MVRKVSLEIEKEIVDQYYDYTAKELGDKYGVNPNTVKGIWNRHGLRGKRQINFPENEFSEFYLNHSIKETAEQFNADRHTIVRFAKTLGIYQKPKKLLTEKEEEEIVDQYFTTSSSKLAKQYGVSKSKISQIWYQNGMFGKSNRTFSYNEFYFEDITTDEQAYWLGFIASDGCIYHPKDTRQDILSISLNKNDIGHLEKFKKALDSDKPITVCGNHANFSISSDILVHHLKNYGIDFRKTYDVNWPDIPYELLPAYVRGYFDGDGSISTSIKVNELYKVQISIAGFEYNLNSFRSYLRFYGIDSTISVDKRKYNTKDGQVFGQLILTNKTTKQDFLHLIYDNATIYLDRKYELAQKFLSLCLKNSKTWTVTHHRFIF